jgi:hypothetical protein
MDRLTIRTLSPNAHPQDTAGATKDNSRSTCRALEIAGGTRSRVISIPAARIVTAEAWTEVQAGVREGVVVPTCLLSVVAAGDIEYVYPLIATELLMSSVPLYLRNTLFPCLLSAG